MDGELHKLRIGTSDKTTYAYPAARAMDVANGYLWLSGNFFIEKRSLVDMSLIDRYDISQYFTGHGGNNWIESITVSSDKIYLMCSWGRLLLLSTDGIVLEEYATYIGLDDMMIANGRMWGVINTDTIYEIDPTTFQAIDTYYLAGNVIISRFQGIAYRDGKIACADFVHNSLRIFQVIMP